MVTFTLNIVFIEVFRVTCTLCTVLLSNMNNNTRITLILLTIQAIKEFILI